MSSKIISTIEESPELPIAFRTRGNSLKSLHLIAHLYVLQFSSPSGVKRRLELAEASKPAKQRRLDQSIDQLPNEMLLEIFTWMDQETLKQSSLVSHKWNGIISQTSETMEKLPLKLKHIHLSKDIKLKRRYQEATLSEISYFSDQLLNELTGIGGTIVKLNLINCVFDSNDIKKLLSCFPFVVALAMQWCVFLYSQEMGVIVPVELSHLKKLKVVGNAGMLEHIKCSVKDFEVSQNESELDLASYSTS